MQRKLTITVDAAVYNGLHAIIGRRNISRFLNDLARPLVTDDGLDSGYHAKGADGAAEREAAEWSEALITDIAHDGDPSQARRGVVGLLRPVAFRGDSQDAPGRHPQQ